MREFVKKFSVKLMKIKLEEEVVNVKDEKCDSVGMEFVDFVQLELRDFKDTVKNGVFKNEDYKILFISSLSDFFYRKDRIICDEVKEKLKLNYYYYYYKKFIFDKYEFSYYKYFYYKSYKYYKKYKYKRKERDTGKIIVLSDFLVFFFILWYI